MKNKSQKKNILEEEYENEVFQVQDYKEDLFNKGKENILKQQNNKQNHSEDKDRKGTDPKAKPKSLLDKHGSEKKIRINHGFDYGDINRQKNVDKELDLGFIPKEYLYNDKTYGESKNNLLAAIEILEKAQDNKNEIAKKEQPQESKSSFWSFMNPFKCGLNN